MLEESAAEAATCKSGRALALAGAACRLRRHSCTQSSSLLQARYDLSHLYRGMRLPHLSEHIKFPRREQRVCENVLLARGLGGAIRQVGGRGISIIMRAPKRYKTKPFWTLSPNNIYICNVLELF